jgi:hypothetical protein
MNRNRNTYARNWTVLADGGSGTYLYAREATPGVFIFIEIMDLPGMMGRGAPARWSASVDVVSLYETSPDTVASAIRSCGWEGLYDIEGGPTPLMLAEVLHSYGAKSPMWSADAGRVNERNRYDSPDERHRPFRDIRAEARREAEALLDADYRDEVLDTRVVNAIGQTAREFADGTPGLWSALRRIAADPNASPSQKLVLKMYGNAGQTLGGDAVPADLRN